MTSSTASTNVAVGAGLALVLTCGEVRHDDAVNDVGERAERDQVALGERVAGRRERGVVDVDAVAGERGETLRGGRLALDAAAGDNEQRGRDGPARGKRCAWVESCQYAALMSAVSCTLKTRQTSEVLGISPMIIALMLSWPSPTLWPTS